MIPASPVRDGVYLVKVRAGRDVDARRLVVLRQSAAPGSDRPLWRGKRDEATALRAGGDVLARARGAGATRRCGLARRNHGKQSNNEKAGGFAKRGEPVVHFSLLLKRTP